VGDFLLSPQGDDVDYALQPGSRAVACHDRPRFRKWVDQLGTTGYNPQFPRIKGSSVFGLVYNNGSIGPDEKMGPGGQLSVAPLYGSGA
jgi:hypothetical protein